MNTWTGGGAGSGAEPGWAELHLLVPQLLQLLLLQGPALLLPLLEAEGADLDVVLLGQPRLEGEAQVRDGLSPEGRGRQHLGTRTTATR